MRSSRFINNRMPLSLRQRSISGRGTREFCGLKRPGKTTPKRFLVIVSLLAVAVSITVLGCGPKAEMPRPNIVVILIDTLRPEFLLEGAEPAAANPYLAGLKTRSSFWPRAVSTSSWTAPSTASLFTALYPNEHGVIMGFMAHQRSLEKLRMQGEASFELNAMPVDVPTLPERLNELGYRCFGLAANINIGHEIGFDRGFDSFKRIGDAKAEELVDHVQEWLPEIEAGPEPYFLYVHFNDPHKPYVPHKPWYTRSTRSKMDDSRARYRSELSYVDQQLARLHEMLDLDRQGLLVIVSDHGEEFMDHGGTGHELSLHRELNDVLMLFSSDELGIQPGAREPRASLIDVAPTVLDLLGAGKCEPGSGLSLAPLLTGGLQAESLEAELAGRMLFAHRRNHEVQAQHLWAAMQGPWKLIQDQYDKPHLYDHRSDPRELQPQGVEGTRAEGLLDALLEFRARPAIGTAEAVDVQLDEDTARQLKSLGYVR